MAVNSKLKEYLDRNQVRYLMIDHSPAYTAQEIAASAHVKGRELIKSVMINADGRHWLAATTSNDRVDLERLRGVLDAREVRLETEAEFRTLFEDCEPGAMPPFGNLYGVPVVVDLAVAEDPEIVFNVGSHTALLQMSYEDFERLVNPRKAPIAARRG